MDAEVADAEETQREFGVNFAALDRKGVAEEEPPSEDGSRRRRALDRSRLGLRSARADDGLCGPVRAPRRPTRRRRRADPRGRRRPDGASTTRTGRSRPARGRDRARRLGGRRHDAASATRCRWPSSAATTCITAGRQRGAQPPDPRFRARLFPRADGGRHPPHHGRRVREPRRAEDPGPARPRRARRARRSSPWASASIRSPGWACAPARPT